MCVAFNSYLDIRYPDIEYRECFPSIESVILKNPDFECSKAELEKIICTFAYHEMGSISPEYVKTLHKMSAKI